MSDNEYMTVAEVAAGFGVSKMTVYRWLMDADTPLDYIRVRRAFRITRASFVKVQAQR